MPPWLEMSIGASLIVITMFCGLVHLPLKKNLSSDDLDNN